MEVKFFELSLFIAIEKRNIEIIKLLLANEKLDINFPCKSITKAGKNELKTNVLTKEKKTAFHSAVLYGDVEIIKLLMMNEKLDINLLYQNIDNCSFQEKKEEKTALQIAVENDNFEIFNRLIINENTDVNLEYKRVIENNLWKKTALYIAVEKENIEMVKILTSHKKIDINIPYKTNENGGYEKRSILNLAIDMKNVEIVRLLLENNKIDINYTCMETFSGIIEEEWTALYKLNFISRNIGEILP